MTTLQASLLFKPLPPLLHFSSSKHVRSLSFANALSCRRLSTTASAPFKTRFCRHNLLLHCTLNPEQVDSSSEFALSNNDDNSIPEMEPIEFNEPSVVQIGSVQNSSIDSNAGVVSSSFSDNEAASEVLVENDELKKKLPILVFLMGVFAKVKKGFENILLSDWFSWWPFWHQEKRLERLIADADANPNDAAMQSALLAELNKHSPESVIRRFEQRAHAVDSRGVAEYMRALVATNAIAEYLPDEQSGKPSSLPSLLQELKQRASGNMDEPFLNPGISEKQPLHVVMVDPKVSNRSSRFAQEFLSTIIFTIAIGLVWIMGATALQKYIGGLGGIGASGVGSSSSYAPKELNKEIMPEKNVKTFKDVKGCDDAKQELEEVVEYLKNPSKFTRLGGKLPKGILLTGAPGTGKTLLAKAIAGEAGVPFFYKAGSEFEEMFVGVGARRVRSLFQAAKKKAPCIIFIDEIDAVGSTRKQWEGHTKKTLHQLLVEMDGFEQNEGIILMAATNLPDILDPALTRPGRFDRHIVVPNPDVRGRPPTPRKTPFLHLHTPNFHFKRREKGLPAAEIFSIPMGEGKQGAMVVEMPNSSNQNPIVQLQNKFKELEIGFKGWLSKQSIPVEAAVVTATSGLQGAAIGGFMGTLTQDVSSSMPIPPAGANLNPQAMASFQQAQALAGGPLVQARNFAVMTGVNAGISCVLKRIRGKEDVQSSMAAAFGSGALFSLVSGMGGPNPVPNALTSGIFFALVQGGLFELGRKFSQPPAEDTHYVRTRSLLSSLGLQNYEKNFKKGLLTDTTLPLLTDSALRDVRIPPGPRLLILDHIQRDPELRKKRG